MTGASPKNATFWSSWLRAGLAPQPFIFWVQNIGSCVLSSSRATKWPPYELILSISKFPHIRYIRLYTAYIWSYTAYIRYMEFPYTIWANPNHEGRAHEGRAETEWRQSWDTSAGCKLLEHGVVECSRQSSSSRNSSTREESPLTPLKITNFPNFSGPTKS